jgi:hypothetical protein
MGVGFMLVRPVLTDAGKRAGHGPRRRARRPRAVPPLLVQERGKRRNGVRVSRGSGRNSFCSPDPPGQPSDGDLRRSTASGSRRLAGRIWPRRDRGAGRNGGPPVGCWASGPGGRGKTGRGLFFLAGGKERCCTVVLSIVYNEFQKLI